VTEDTFFSLSAPDDELTPPSAALLVSTTNLGEVKSRVPPAQADVRILGNGP
jgi:hypothetical protein